MIRTMTVAVVRKIVVAVAAKMKTIGLKTGKRKQWMMIQLKTGKRKLMTQPISALLKFNNMLPGVIFFRCRCHNSRSIFSSMASITDENDIQRTERYE
mmetsp:Transcript_8345/g.20494  ORF Transcript_8345/g.20494 Transcript_8345/m.20494 type:complete len:98 (+) Transcript_8345:2645-2938(+)